MFMILCHPLNDIQERQDELLLMWHCEQQWKNNSGPITGLCLQQQQQQQQRQPRSNHAAAAAAA